MQRKKPDVDVIKDVLEAVLAAYPSSEFVKSINHQYIERGGLSKKQLQGLHGKAVKVTAIPAAKLATLEAVILKKPTRYKSTAPVPPAQDRNTKDEESGRLIEQILLKSPRHKRVLFLKARFDNNETLTASDKEELNRFFKLLEKK